MNGVEHTSSGYKGENQPCRIPLGVLYGAAQTEEE